MLMEGLHSPHTIAKPANPRKAPSNNSQKDLWLITQEGSLAALESALLLLKKNGGNIDSRNAFGLTPLHIATWRNNVPIVKRLLAAGADPNARDGESGWSSLHRALHFGHLAVAGVLLQSGASLTLEDCKGRTPIDLLSGPVLQASGFALDTVATEVFSWGSGTNYQLGTGNAHIQKLPCKVDALHGFSTKIVASAKFHSVAVGAGGELYTWGFGRGGRLGHPDFDIHSGQAAVITPRQVTVGLASRQVKAVAVAKHHTIIATENGEVYTWGSNREGQLGYTVDTQPTPRRVSSLRHKIVAVAAANKHSAAVAESGEIFTWGCNKEGQLGYGTSNSASNYIPRLVESLKGKSFTAISAAKYHTNVLSREGEVFTWGHRLVTPRRVIISRNLKKSGIIPLKFHRMERLHVVSIAAGVVHSTALTDDGALFYWASSDPDLRCQQMYSMSGRDVVSISAGKYWTAAVTDTGDVYYWDGKKHKVEMPTPTRLHGVKRATSVSVGETHMLVSCALYHPNYGSKIDSGSKKPMLNSTDHLDELDEALIFNYIESSRKPTTTIDKDDSLQKPIPSLKSLCERTAVEFLLETRNAVQLLEIADSLEADSLKAHCEDIVIRNLDFIFAVSAPAITSASVEILAKLEKSLDAKSSESWSYRRLPTLTATFPAVIDTEDDGVDKGRCLRLRDNHVTIMKDDGDSRSESFLHPSKNTGEDTVKQVRALKKKLQQIEMLENKVSNGHTLDDQQVMKIQSRPAIESTLAELGFPVESQSKLSHPITIEGKGNKLEAAKKQRRKKKQLEDEPIETTPSNSEIFPTECISKGYADTKIIDISIVKENTGVSGLGKINIMEGFYLENPEGTPSEYANNHMISKPIQSKKKNKKGGLSMFLSGALDDTPKEIIPPPTTKKKEGPAWGGAKVLKGSSSLRDIQVEQSKLKESQPIKIQNDPFKDSVESKNSGYIQLSSFLPGSAPKPIAFTPPRDMHPQEAEKSTPPWSQGTSGSSRPSLREIQMQQKKKHSISNSPKIRTTGFTTSTGQSQSTETSNCVNETPSRWFKPETEAPSSIRSIQIEEKAMKEFKRYYSSVKLVKTQRQGS